MKNKWKSLLSNFAFLSVSYIAFMKIVFGEFDGQTVFVGIFNGLFCTLFFNSVFPRMMKKTGDTLFRTVELELRSDETLVLKAAANHVKGWEAVGGVLVLTDTRLVFRSHKFNIQNHQQEFPVGEIKAFFPDHQLAKALKVELANNEKHTFVVESPSDWIHALTGQQA